MPSKYLFLAIPEKSSTQALWENLPTLSQSSRECYLSVCSAKLIFENEQDFYGVTLKMDLPVMNYASSSNSIPVVAMLSQGTNNIDSSGQGNTTENKV